MKKGILQILYIYDYFLRRPHKILFGNAYETHLANIAIVCPLGIFAAIYLFLQDHHPFISIAILMSLFLIHRILKDMRLQYISEFINRDKDLKEKMISELLNETLFGSSLAKHVARECALSAFADSKLRNSFLPCLPE